ncbi:histidine kinase [Vibrio variabilis]|uniref:histidine kinase n=1 Tax=Vibrio variabilis TaxID=990271 RepID=A0ABR4YGF1_9VIBR|nr:ATP-binding protein [Vibrio variabilis]KHA62360.1 histidine kinase [Vibrio variabilis]
MLLTRMSIKSRLLILCLLPTIVIVLLSANQVHQIQERLESYQVISEKNASINLLMEYSHHSYAALSKQLSGQDGQTSIALAQSSLDLLLAKQNKMLSNKAEREVSSSYVVELHQLITELNQASPQQTVELGRLIYDILYDLYSSILFTEGAHFNSRVHQLDIILSDLSWLHFWMEREAWLVKEVETEGWPYADFAPEYFRISERQQYYLDKFISLGADTQQFQGLLQSFTSPDFQQGAFVKEQLLYNRFSQQEVQQAVLIVEKRNQLLEKQLITYSRQLQQELIDEIETNQYIMWGIASAGLVVFFLLFAWGASTLYRINSKLTRILTVMSNMRDSGHVDQIPIDGNDEFTRFAHELNDTIARQKAYQTKLVEAKEHAEAANQAKSVFLANMSHEIRTPLNGIIGMTEILSDSQLNGSQKEILNDIDASSHALLVLINDILDLSKIESGNLVLSPHTANLREIIFDTMNMVNAQALKQEVTLEVEFADDVPVYAEMDEFRVKQILMNLLSNAIKFSANGSVLVRHSVDGQHRLNIEVLDTGVGIAADKLSDIFKPFTQEDGTITRRFGGTGLGLAICRQLVELMRGELVVESRVGEGSRFTVILPLVKPQRPPVPVCYDLKVLFISNQATHQQLAYKECVRLCSSVTQSENCQQVTDLSDGFDLVVYCLARHSKSRQDLAKLRAQFTSADIIGLQHHLYIEPDLEGLLVAQVTLPILGKRFENVLSQCQNDSRFRIARQVPPPMPDTGDVKRVLIVEDNLMNQKIASFFLSKVGIEFAIASNGLEALNLVKSGQEYCAVLMDCMMPIMDGLTATKEIRNWERENQKAPVPIIALTASVLPEEIQSCFDAGMDAYLPKPYKSKQLFDIFEKLSVTF